MRTKKNKRDYAGGVKILLVLQRSLNNVSITKVYNKYALLLTY